MTNVNRTFGNFAPGMSESFMVLNRNYSINANKQIEDLTTYIDPVKFNYIFADTNLDAMNFWVQTRFDIKVRRLISTQQKKNYPSSRNTMMEKGQQPYQKRPFIS